MKIALVGAEFEENLSLRYIWSALERAGHEVVPIIFNHASETGRAAKELAASKADIAGFSMVFTHRAREFATLASAARIAGYTGHIVAGGHFAAFNAEALLRDVPGFSSVAIGQGEACMTRLAENRGDPKVIDGFVWRDEQGNIIRNPAAKNQDDLDTIKWPLRKDPPDRFLDIPVANMLSSRGCTHCCAFCSIAAWHRLCGGSRHAFRSVENVADEMADLYGKGYRIFNFHDDNFLLPSVHKSLNRITALKKALKHRGIGRIAFAIKARPDEVEKELFSFLRDMGLFRVFLGIEAGTARSLTALGRGQTVKENETALNIVNDLGLHACFNLLLFNPDSTFDDFIANVRFLCANPLNPMNFCRTEIYEGTPLKERLERQGRLEGDYWGYDYEIADPKAELACGIMYKVFKDRCYGVDALHHLTMAVDYEEKLLCHFYVRDARLHHRVKEYVKSVNMNTSDYLLKIAFAVDQELRSDSAARDFTGDIYNQIAIDTQKLRSAGQSILRQIRYQSDLSKFGRKNHFWAGRAIAVAGLTAAVATAQCDKTKKLEGAMDSNPRIEKFHSIVSEMIAPPPTPPDSEKKPDIENTVKKPKYRGQNGSIPTKGTHIFEMAPPRPRRTDAVEQVPNQPSLDDLSKKYHRSDPFEIGRMAINEGHFHDAIAAFEAAAEGGPQSDEKMIYLLWAYVETGRTKDAIFLANSQQSNDGQFVYLCGRAYQMANKLIAALEYYTAALTKTSVIRPASAIRNDALFYSASILSERYEDEKSEDNCIQARHAWSVVKRIYEKEPEHSRYKKAVEELDGLQ
jgi:anaerobic magnesium-protoporphyrin IX monomethyl ester cyclase